MLETLNTGLFQDNIFTRKLTLISAPAGFGKATLLSEWLDGNSHEVSWLTLDRRDNDPVQYWSCIIKALQRKAAGCGNSFLSFIQSGEANVADNSQTAKAGGVYTLWAEVLREWNRLDEVVIMTALFNSSRGSLIIAVLFHFQINNPIWPDGKPWDFLLFSIVAVIIVIINQKKMLTREDSVTGVLMPDEEGGE